MLRQRAQPARDRGELREAGAVGVRQRLERRLGAGEQARAVRELGVRGADLGPFTLPHAELSQFISILENIASFGLALPELALRLRGEPLEALPGAEGFGGLARERQRLAV